MSLTLQLMAASLLVAGWNPKVLLIDRIGTSEDGLYHTGMSLDVSNVLNQSLLLPNNFHNAHVPQHSSAEGLLPHMASFTNANGRGHSNLIHLYGGNQGATHNCKAMPEGTRLGTHTLPA